MARVSHPHQQKQRRGGRRGIILIALGIVCLTHFQRFALTQVPHKSQEVVMTKEHPSLQGTGWTSPLHIL